MESRSEKIFSMGINCMSLVVWLVEDRNCSSAVVGLDLVLGYLRSTMILLCGCDLNCFHP